MPKRHRRVSMKRWLLHWSNPKSRRVLRSGSDRSGAYSGGGDGVRYPRSTSASSRIIFGIPWRQARWLLDEEDFLEPFGLDGRHRISPSFDGGADNDAVMACGLRRDEIFDLMNRDIRPEDFELLSKLDDVVPNRNTAEQSLVEGLPEVRLSSCSTSECGVCLGRLAEPVVQLPCRHAFHQACISRWLTQCKNACPLCSASIDLSRAAASPLQATSGAKCGKVGHAFSAAEGVC